MAFQSLNQFNIFVNMLSGNLLPVTKDETSTSALLKIYAIICWIMKLVYIVSCVLGLFYVPKEKALIDGTVNMIVVTEVTVVLNYLYTRKKLTRELIEKLSRVFTTDNEMLQSTTLLTVKPVEKILKIYISANFCTVVLWCLTPFTEIFKRDQFYYVDYRMPAVLSREPFSVNVFTVGVLFQFFGGLNIMFRKMSLDVYTIHFILLTTAQYKYLRVKFETILQSEVKSLSLQRHNIKKELRMLTRHYQLVVEISQIMKKLFSPNIGFLYINNVFRFCFLSFMAVTGSGMVRFLAVSYSVGALTQLYVLCFCVQQLLEAVSPPKCQSTTVFDDAFHAKWYVCDIPSQRMVAAMSLTSKMGCRLSSLRNIDLTLSSLMVILNQAYSISLLFLKATDD